MSGVLMKISVLYKKLNTVGLFYNFFPPPLHMCTQEWRQPRKNQKYYIGTRLDNTVHVQQQTPFSNVKSPESPKHRKERVMA